MTDARDPILLETERLTLRRFTPADADALLELDSDPEVTFFITGGTPEFAPAMLDAWLREYTRWPGYGTFAAIDRASGDFVGWFHLRPEPGGDDEPEPGYRLRRSAWGRGLATEGSRALINLAFGGLGARRVWAAAMSVNAASRRVMEKSGMRQVRTFHADCIGFRATSTAMSSTRSRVPTGTPPADGPRAARSAARYRARMRLLRGLCSSSAKPSASRSGGRYIPNRPR